MERPEYVAKRSAWAIIRFWRFLVFWIAVPAILYFGVNLLELGISPLIAPIAWLALMLIIFICRVIKIKCHRVEFYRNKVVEKWGVFDIEKKSNVFTAVLAVKVDQRFWGRIFGYGEVKVDMVGPWDVDLTRIKKPKKLQNYLDQRIAYVKGMHQFMPNH